MAAAGDSFAQLEKKLFVVRSTFLQQKLKEARLC